MRYVRRHRRRNPVRVSATALPSVDHELTGMGETRFSDGPGGRMGARWWRRRIHGLIRRDSMPAWIVESARVVHRRSKTVTSPWRPFPQLLLAGVEKGGTTSMFRYLADHPLILPQEKKEINYFNSAQLPSAAWYRSHSPLGARLRMASTGSTPGAITFDSTPTYFFHPTAPQRVAQLLPDVRVVVLLRNPIDRAFSHYLHRCTVGRETEPFKTAYSRSDESVDSLRELLAQDPDLNGPAARAFRRPCYLARGVYADQYERWTAHIDESRLLVLKSEDLFTQPSATVETVLRFLGLPSAPQSGYEVFNPRRQATEMSSEDRAALSAFFQPHNARLEELTGIQFGWD